VRLNKAGGLLLAQAQKRKKEEAEKEQQKQKKDSEVEKRRKALSDNLKKNSVVPHRAKLAKAKEEAEAAAAAQRARDKEHKHKLKAAVDKVGLLMSEDRQREIQLNKRRKALLSMKESLDKAGLKDYDRFFDRQELEKLGLKF